MRAEPLLRRISAVGAAAQASVPGAYAWGVTVLPCATARASPAVAKVAAGCALLALAGGVAGDARWGHRARVLSFWAFVVASGVAWSVTAATSSAHRYDTPRGLAGMLGWALFALASAAPAVPAPASASSEVEAPAPPSRSAGPRAGGGDLAYVAAGALAATVLEGIGWRIGGVERALLVRVLAIVAGLSLIGAATQAALVRHSPRVAEAPRRRLQRAMVPLVTLAMLGLVGLLLVLRD